MTFDFFQKSKTVTQTNMTGAATGAGSAVSSSTAPVSRKGGGGGEGETATAHKALHFRPQNDNTASVSIAPIAENNPGESGPPPPVMNDVGNRGSSDKLNHPTNKQLHTTAAVVLNEESRTPASTAVEMSSAQAAEALCVGPTSGVNGAPADSAVLDPQVKISNL